VALGRKPHDIGGLCGDAINPAEHDTAYWEWQIDALVRLCFAKGLMTDFAELRHGIESLAVEDYEKLSYYERWAKSTAVSLVKSGVIDADELEQRITLLAGAKSEEDAAVKTATDSRKGCQ
tara:strand:+ start:2610 stop:2972 length:363 start_codon:yes stop_codon:yes gene_type:complete